MDHKESSTNSPVSTSAIDGSTKFVLNNPTVQTGRNKSYDVGSNPLGKVDASAARPCAIIGPDRVLPPHIDDTMYLKRMPSEGWPPPESVYRRPPDYPTKVSDYQPTRNISPRQTFQENMQRILVPPTFSSMKNNDESNLKNSKLSMPQEAKYCDVPYNYSSVNSDHKSVRNSDIPMSNVNPYSRNMPPPYGWPTGVNVRPLRPYGAPEFYQYQEFSSCAGPRPMTMICPHRPLHEDSAQVYSERLYQDANIRFKPYPTVKDKHPQPRYDYISNYPNTFHPPVSVPPHKYDLQKSIHGHPYPIYPPVPLKYLDRRLHESFVDGYHRSHSQQANVNTFHNQVGLPPYGSVPGNCLQNRTYSDPSSKPLNVNNNNKVYHNLESRNKNYSVTENIYYNDMNSQALRSEILLPTHSTLNMHPMSQHSIYRKDNTPVKSYDFNSNYRIYDQSVNVNHPLQRLPLQFSPNTVSISPSDSNTSNDTIHTIGTSQEDCGYVSQSSTASIKSLDSSNISIPHDIYRRHIYNNYDMVRNTFHSNGPIHIPNNKTSANKKNLNVRQFLQMWNEGDEEVSDCNKDVAFQNNTKKQSQSEIINNQEQLYVLGLVNVPNEELGKYDHIQKISKLPENIKGYNSLEILNQYEKLLEAPHVINHNKSREYNAVSKSLMDKDITIKMPRPVSPLDVEAKISQSVIHKEVGCNFEIKPCSPEMLNVQGAAPVQSLLGERMIEKVINPIVAKSPNLTRGESNKLQNTMNDAIKPASCKMISGQYLSNTSPNRIKTNNYSVQDLENNSGLCLASLPQLDNDIEINFTEINQQFIKANQIGITPGLQNITHVDVDKQQTNHCLSHEIKNDSDKDHIITPLLPLGSVIDKEHTKLSKYRKGKKSELTHSHNILKYDTVKTVESVSASQRIDSVIIKNPDTVKVQNNNDFGKISSQSNDHIVEGPKPLYSTLKLERSIEIPSETAIDFSLNRSEDETVVRYLDTIDSNINQNLPQLEGFNDAGLCDGNNVSLSSNNVEVQNEAPNLNISPVQVQCDQFNITEHYENSLTIGQVIEDNKCDSPINLPINSPNTTLVEEHNVLTIRKLGCPEPEISTIESQPIMGNIENIESPVINIKTNSQELLEKNSFKNPIKDINIKPESVDENKKGIDFISNIKDSEELYNNRDQSTTDVKKELLSNMVTEISFDRNVKNTDLDNNCNSDTEDQMVEVLKDLSNQGVNNFAAKHTNLCNVIDNEISEDFLGLDNSYRKKENITENALNISIVDQTDKKSSGIKCANEVINDFIVSENSFRKIEHVTESVSNIPIVSDTESLGVEKKSEAKDNCLDKYQLLTSEPILNDIKVHVYNKKSATVMCQGDSDINVLNISGIMSSKCKEMANNKIDTSFTDFAAEIKDCKLDTELNSTLVIPQENKISECLSETNDNDNKTAVSMTNESFLVTHETKHESTKLDVSSDILNDETENLTVDVAFNNIAQKIVTLTAIAEEKDNGTNIAIDKVDIRNKIDEDLHLSVGNKISKIPDISLNDADSKLETDRDCLGYGTNICEMVTGLTIKTDIKIAELSQETDINSLQVDYKITDIESDFTTKNINFLENSASEFMHVNDNDLDTSYETQIENKTENDCFSVQPHIKSIEPRDESLSNSHHRIKIECSTCTLSACKPKINIDNINTKNIFDVNLEITESECLSINPINIEDKSFSNDTREKISKPEKCRKIIEKKDSLISGEKWDILDPDVMGLDLKHNINDEIELLSDESIKCRSLLELNVRRQDYEINKLLTKCHKELFSPWIQKLSMFSEGICNTIKNNGNLKQDDNYNKITNASLGQNVHIDLSTNNNMEAFKSCNNIVNYEDCDDKPVVRNVRFNDEVSQIEYNEKRIQVNNDKSNEPYEGIKNKDKISPGLVHNSGINDSHDVHIINEIALSEFNEKRVPVNNGKSNEPYEDIKYKDNILPSIIDNSGIHDSCDVPITNQNSLTEYIEKRTQVNTSKSNEPYEGIQDKDKISSGAIDNNAVVKPRKITKRSLSDSAIESYRDNNDGINSVQPCKRKKSMKENQSFLDSHIITEDLCNIIQTNRRNSISTFYNEENYYIVIDNDLFSTGETEDSGKICYTETGEEFSTSEMHLNLETSYTDESSQICKYSDSYQHIEERSFEDSWVNDVACIETVFSEDVAENITIDLQTSPNKESSLDLESVDEESSVYCSHIDKIKSIYGRSVCKDNTQLIETLYRTPQMNVNKTLYHIESQDLKECHEAINENCFKSNEHINCTDVVENELSSYKIIGNKECISENLTINSKQHNLDIYANVKLNNEFNDNYDIPTEEKKDDFTSDMCESSNDYLTSNSQKENSGYSCSSSPEVSSTTSEEKSSSILLKITNCNGSRVSQINEVINDSQNKLSYKLTEKGEYHSYTSNFSSTRTLITKAAQKYIPPLKETIYDFKVKLPLPQQRLHLLKQLKISKIKPKINTTPNICTDKRHKDITKKQKPKFEDVLKSIDEINIKRHKNHAKKGVSIPKVIIKKNENGAHYASNKTTTNRKETYNPDLTGCKWQPWVFLEKNNFIDKMALQNKAKAVFCHRKNNYVLLEKFRKYKSVYNANFVMSQPKSVAKGNLKYTIRLKHKT